MLRPILTLLLGASLNLCHAQNIDSLSAKEAVVIALQKNYSVQISEAQKEISKNNKNTKVEPIMRAKTTNKFLEIISVSTLNRIA